MLALFLFGCVLGNVKALEAEVEALKDEVDELEEELDEQSQVDTGEPVDTGDSGGGDTEETLFEVPTVNFTRVSAGGDTFVSTYQITGDYDTKRVWLNYGGQYDEPEEDCLEVTHSGSGVYLYVEFWYDGEYACWSLQSTTSYPDCRAIPFGIASQLTCD